MKLKLSYSELNSALGMSSIILSDKIVDEKLKNVIFMIKKGVVNICFYNALTFCRTELENAEVSQEEGKEDWIFQVKASDLSKLLSGFSSLYKTEVEKIEFEGERSKVKVSVTEKALKEEDSRLSQVSVFHLDNVPLLDSVEKDIKMEFPQDPEIIFKGDLDLYMSSLLPLMNSASNLESKLNFSEDYVFVIAAYMCVFFKNKLPDQMKNMTLGYSSVSLIKRLCDINESSDILVKKTDLYLCMRAGSTEAFMRHQPVKVRHKQYISMFSKDNGVMLNRLYFKDVLKRMGNMSTDSSLKILENGDINVENQTFSQVIPVEKVKGEVSDVGFKITVSVIEKLLVGKDTLFPENVFMYIKKAGSGYALFFADKTGSWFSMTQVR